MIRSEACTRYCEQPGLATHRLMQSTSVALNGLPVGGICRPQLEPLIRETITLLFGLALLSNSWPVQPDFAITPIKRAARPVVARFRPADVPEAS